MIKELHQHPLIGYYGADRIQEIVGQAYYVPKLKRKIVEVLQKCNICLRMKVSRKKPKGKLQPLTIPNEPWEGITFDLIVKLPKSKELLSRVQYNSIWVLSDYLMKYAYFILYKEESRSMELAYMVMRIMIANHGVPRYIVSDRTKPYIFKFWKALTGQLGIDHRALTAYHPQTDRMVERLNQTLKQYLRMFVSKNQ
jgi:hypothetical protein